MLIDGSFTIAHAPLGKLIKASFSAEIRTTLGVQCYNIMATKVWFECSASTRPRRCSDNTYSQTSR